MSEQIAVRIPDKLARELDAVVERGDYGSRAEAVRLAIRTLIEADRRRHVGDAIVDGYQRVPQSDDELAHAVRAAVASIEEEPW